MNRSVPDLIGMHSHTKVALRVIHAVWRLGGEAAGSCRVILRYLTMNELQDGLPAITQSPKDEGTLALIVCRPGCH